MLFRQLFDYDTWTYTYLIADRETKEAVLVDPVLEQVDRDQRLLEELGLNLKYCLETHLHADHITGSGHLRERLGCESVVPGKAKATCADHFIQDGETISVSAITIQAIATPGHTDSHMAYLINEHLLTGDSLFIRGCGRTDFQSGDPGVMYDAVVNKLFTLSEETLVYPGHDYRGHTVSTIREEKRWNPRFVDLHTGKLRSRDNFMALMNDLKLPNPKRIMEAVPANEKCGGVPLMRKN